MRTLALLATFLLLPGAAFADGQAWSLVDDNYGGIATNWWSVPAFADIDADGDQDMFLGNGDTISFYRNDGTPQVAQWTLVTGSYAGAMHPRDCAAPDFVDIDADGDYDFFLSGCGHQIFFYRNDGTPSAAVWTLVTDFFIPEEDFPPLGCSHIPTFVDLDTDTDFDFFLDSCDWIAIYYENVGTNTAYSFDFTFPDPWDGYERDFVYEAVGLEWFGNYVAPQDVDQDGDLDLLVSDTNVLAFLRNVGGPTAPSWQLGSADYPGIAPPARLSYNYVFPRFVDIDADGQDEVVMGDIDGLLSLYEPVPDADTDGIPDTDDCDDADSQIYPGKTEIRHDGVDQDCNGYDLTTDVREATYDDKKDKLTVVATSGLGASAALTLNGFGAMTWTGSQWEYLATAVTSDPQEVTVCGVEGCYTAGTVTYQYEQHQFAFVDAGGNLLDPPGEEKTLDGVRTGDTLLMRLAFTDNGDMISGADLRLKYYTSRDDFFNDVNYGYVVDADFEPLRASDWYWEKSCALGTWCDHTAKTASAVTTDHAPQFGYAFEGDYDRFYWAPAVQSSGCENNFHLRYAGVSPQSVSYWFRYELNGIAMPYSGMHYGGNKGPAVRTLP